MRFMRLKLQLIAAAIVIVCCAGAISPSIAANSKIKELYRTNAGNDYEKLREQVELLSRLAREKIDEIGFDEAMKLFRNPPWKRLANGLHLWGVTTEGFSWFDAGHPELEGLNVSEMSDLFGRNWAKFAIASAQGTGPATFEITFPHPSTKNAARGLHNCFSIEGGKNVLCAGAFLDSQ